ncbi:hypothetical protein D1872_289100 [compost metagenome]
MPIHLYFVQILSGAFIPHFIDHFQIKQSSHARAHASLAHFHFTSHVVERHGMVCEEQQPIQVPCR